tara:strand:- start:155 stop:319 length:165 start_codon:yes stop_codon:yes gene_type:complete
MTWYKVTFGTVFVEAESEEEATIKAGKLVAEDAEFFVTLGGVEISDEDEEHDDE